jgi:hypothetical protein
MADPLFLSAFTDLRGAAALQLIPAPEATASEVVLLTENVERVDAFTGCALRSVAEHFARRKATRVILAAPTNEEVYRTLWHLLGDELPKHFCVSNDAAPPTKGAPRTIILPATLVRSVSEGEMIANVIPRLGAALPAREVRFIAGAFGELVYNALVHSDDSQNPTVTAIFHERGEHTLQLVVLDLGARIARAPDAAEVLSQCMLASEASDGALAGLAEQIERRNLDARIEIAAGNGRISWDDSGWAASPAQHVNGFSASVSVRL